MKYRILFKTPPGFRDHIRTWTKSLLSSDSDVSVKLAEHELGFTGLLNEKQIAAVLTQSPWFEDIMIAALWRGNVPHREFIFKELKNALVFFKEFCKNSPPSSIGLAVKIKHDSVHTVKRVREAFVKIFPDYKVHGQDLHSELEAQILIEKGKMEFWVSLSGSGLYKRGQREVQGFLAPMREDLAASLLTMTLPADNFVLWLPFAGSGTYFFASYALVKGFFHPNATNLYAFKARFFDLPPEPAAPKSLHMEHAFLEDIHRDSLKKLRLDIEKLNLNNFAEVFDADFFKTKPDRFTDTNVYLSINPSWGLRLGKIVDSEFFRRIGRKIASMTFKNLTGFVLCPDEKSSHAFCQGLGSKTQIHHFTQGGKHIRAVIFSQLQAVSQPLENQL